MNNTAQPYVYKFFVGALTSGERAQELQKYLAEIPGIVQVDVNRSKQLVRFIGTSAIDIAHVRTILSEHGFRLEDQMPSATKEVVTVGVSGMTCRSCELTVERKWKKIPGIQKVDVNAATGQARIFVHGRAPTIDILQQALGDSTYTVHKDGHKQRTSPPVKYTRPTLSRLVSLLMLIAVLGTIVSRLGLLKPNVSIGNGMSFGAIFVIGLVAASSSCIAIAGGLLLSTAAKFNERYVSARPLARMRPVLLFVLGRIIGYALLGGLLGVVGAALSPSPIVTALIAIIAALYMIIMGLDMLQMAPAWLKGLMPRMPKGLSHRIMDAEGREHPLAPFVLGGATFFLPCGFTQALQLYALTTGSFMTGAITLFAFALGTAPALLALGWASSSLKGKTGQFFFQFSGALVVVLGLWNIQNGLAIMGHPISFTAFAKSFEAPADAGVAVPIVNGTQVVRMDVGLNGYTPNHFVIRSGIPVRWEVNGANAAGCASVLVSRQLSIQKLLSPGVNTFEFTPEAAGTIAFSCSMGMYRGSFTVTS